LLSRCLWPAGAKSKLRMRAQRTAQYRPSHALAQRRLLEQQDRRSFGAHRRTIQETIAFTPGCRRALSGNGIATAPAKGKRKGLGLAQDGPVSERRRPGSALGSAEFPRVFVQPL